MAREPCATLPGGQQMPLMGFGTWMVTFEPERDLVVKMVEQALEIGYRHVDTAQIYGTESMVGQAVRNQTQKGLITRKDVFITTKLWRNSHSRDVVVPSLKKSLSKMGLEYVDLFLIHWPNAFQTGEVMIPRDDSGHKISSNIDYLETWKGLEDCVDQGLTRNIGLSNFSSKQIQRILDNCRIEPANLQIESHPFLLNAQLVNFCHQKNISVTAFSPLAGHKHRKYVDKAITPLVFENETLAQVAKKYGRTPGQVALRYQLERGVAVVPKSAKRERMLENFQALDFTLSGADIRAIEGCDVSKRLLHEDEFKDHPHYPFNDPY